MRRSSGYGGMSNDSRLWSMIGAGSASRSRPMSARSVPCASSGESWMAGAGAVSGWTGAGRR